MYINIPQLEFKLLNSMEIWKKACQFCSLMNLQHIEKCRQSLGNDGFIS